MDPKCNHKCPYKREAEQDLSVVKEKGIWPQKYRLKWWSQKPGRSAISKSGRWGSPQEPPEETSQVDILILALLDLFLTSDLQNDHRIRLSCSQ